MLLFPNFHIRYLKERTEPSDEGAQKFLDCCVATSDRKSKSLKAENLQRRNIEREKVKTHRLAQQQQQADFQVLFDNLNHSEYQTGQLELLFESLGYEPIFTPPYTPQLQPIEMIWSFVKRYVASKYQVGRTLQETTNQLMEGFYGNGAAGRKRNDGCTKELCQKYIEKRHKWAQEFIERDSVLKGALIDFGATLVEPASSSEADSQSSHSAIGDKESDAKTG